MDRRPTQQRRSATMSTILSRLAAVGIIAGGFALTGDLGRLAKRGLEVVNARDVPTATVQRPVDQPADQHGHSPFDADTTSETALAGPQATAHSVSASGTATPEGPVHGQATPHARPDFRPPRGGVEQVSLATLDAGDRVVVWLALQRRSGGRAYRCLVFDVVDPAGGEALAYEAVSFAADGTPQATSVTPRRVRLQGDGLGGASRT